jgi:hypothetical protein
LNSFSLQTPLIHHRLFNFLFAPPWLAPPLASLSRLDIATQFLPSKTVLHHHAGVVMTRLNSRISAAKLRKISISAQKSGMTICHEKYKIMKLKCLHE